MGIQDLIIILPCKK